MSDASDDLRIIARDGGRLDLADRARIIAAAEELEQALAANTRLYQSLVEANAHRIAVNDQLMAVRKKLPLPAVEDRAWGYSTGWYRLEVL